jgi:hypothetical protein
MSQSNREDKKRPESRSSSTPKEKESSNDSALVSALERLAFRLHDIGNRLLGLLK